MEKALRFTLEGVAAANELRRQPSPLHDLVRRVWSVAGSDGFSGLSANPAIGHCADLSGGARWCRASEFPELCGVEQKSCDRCVTPELAGGSSISCAVIRRLRKRAIGVST